MSAPGPGMFNGAYGDIRGASIPSVSNVGGLGGPFNANAVQGVGGVGGIIGQGVVVGGVEPKVVAKIYSCVQQLALADQRPHQLSELVNICKQFQDINIITILAPIMWHSFGTIAVLIQEIVSFYPYIVMNSLQTVNIDLLKMAIKRTSDAIFLLNILASHSETKVHFLNAYIPLYLNPFISSNERTFENLRFYSLLNIASLVKVQNGQQEIIRFLLNADFLLPCLEVLKCRNDDFIFRSQLYAIYILSKILQDDQGLTYACEGRFNAVANSLSSMINKLVEFTKSDLHMNQQDLQQQGKSILQYSVTCYRRLSEYRAARDLLRQLLPEALKNGALSKKLLSEEDVIVQINLINQNLATGTTDAPNISHNIGPSFSNVAANSNNNSGNNLRG